MPWTAAAGMAIGGLLGGAAQGGISYASAQQQQQAQRDAYQKRYQWTVEDLRKAGLNPVLAAQHGAGNVGPMAQMDSSGIASAVQAASQIALQKSQADAASSQASLSDTQANLTSVEAQNKAMEGRMMSLGLRMMDPSNSARAGLSRTEKLFGMAKASQMAGLPLSSLAGPAASAFGSTLQAGTSLLPLAQMKGIINKANRSIKAIDRISY